MNRMIYFAGAALLVATSCKDKDIKGDAAMATMNAYAKGYNILIEEVPNLLGRYFENVPEDGPTPESLKQKGTMLCSGAGFMEMKRKEVREAFAEGKKAAPETLEHLGPMSDDLLEVSTKITETHDQMCKYIDAEDYKDDNGKKASEYHGQWVELAGKYQAATQKFSAALDEIEDQQLASEIEKHAKDKGYSYWFRHFNLQAKKFLAAVRATPADYATHAQTLSAEYQGLSEFVEGKGAEINSAFKSYQTQADRLFAEVKKTGRGIKEAADDASRQEALSSGLSSMVSAYNSMVSVGNTLAELEGNDLLK